MEETANNFEALYSTEPPQGEPILPPLPEKFNILDEAPSASEVCKRVMAMKNGKAPGASGMRVEDLKLWVRDFKAENGDSAPFLALMGIIKAIWQGDMPQALSVAVFVGCFVLVVLCFYYYLHSPDGWNGSSSKQL